MRYDLCGGISLCGRHQDVLPGEFGRDLVGAQAEEVGGRLVDDGRSAASSRLRISRSSTSPVSIQRQPNATLSAGELQVVLRMVSRMAGTSSGAAAIMPNRKPAATLLDRPET